MKMPRIFTPHNPLADRLHDRRGVDATSATVAAQTAVRRLAPEVLAEVDLALDTLTHDLALHRGSEDESFSYDPTRIYAGADALAGLAAAIGRPQLGQAAGSLCRLISEERAERPEAIAVHIEALMLIRRDEAAGEFILPGLRRLSEHSATEPSGPAEPGTRPQALAAPVG